MCGHTAEDKRSEEGQRYDEHVKEAIVALSHAVPHPRAVMIKPLCRKRKKKKVIINSALLVQITTLRYFQFPQSSIQIVPMVHKRDHKLAIYSSGTINHNPAAQRIEPCSEATKLM